VQVATVGEGTGVSVGVAVKGSVEVGDGVRDGVRVGSKRGVGLGKRSRGIAVGAKLGIIELAELLATSGVSPARDCGEQAAKISTIRDIIIQLSPFLPREFTRRLR
jgi:hypothetical protein